MRSRVFLVWIITMPINCSFGSIQKLSDLGVVRGFFRPGQA
jgi:hypothetical protein